MYDLTAADPVRVAILLPTYNGARFLPEQLESIFSLEGVKSHVFVNDDGSTDNTRDILEEYASLGLEFITPKNCGGAAQNVFHLIMNASFEGFDYVCLADQDDIWLPNKLSRAIGILRANGLGAYSSDVTSFWPDGRQVYIRKSQPFRRFDHMFESGGPGNTFVFTTQVALQIRDFLDAAPPDQISKIALHDWLIFAWCRENQIPWQIDRFSGLHYRQHDSNVFGASTGMIAVRKRIHQLQSGWYGEQIMWIATLTKIGSRSSDAARLLRFLEAPDLPGLIFALRNMRECRRKTSEASALAIFFFMRYLGLS